VPAGAFDSYEHAASFGLEETIQPDVLFVKRIDPSQTLSPVFTSVSEIMNAGAESGHDGGSEQPADDERNANKTAR
jgi:hypothetical protein